MDAVVDRFVVGRKHEKAIKAGIAATLLVGDGLMQVAGGKGASKADADEFYAALAATASLHLRRHSARVLHVQQSRERLSYLWRSGRGQTHPSGAAHPGPARSIGRMLRPGSVQVQPGDLGRAHHVQPRQSNRILTRHPWKKLPKQPGRILFGVEPKKIIMTAPPEAKVKRDDWEGHEVGFRGIARRIERHYRRYRQSGQANSGMEAWLDKVMVERTCPDCNGARLRATRQLFTVAGKNHPRSRSAPLRRAGQVSREPSSRPAAAPMPASRCSTKSADG